MYSSQEWWSSGATAGAGGGGPVDPGDPIGESLRFRGSTAYLENTTIQCPLEYTFSAWVKIQGNITSHISLFGQNSSASGTNGPNLGFTSNNFLQYYVNAGFIPVDSTGVFRDPSAWYHVVAQQRSDGFTAWINGEQAIASSQVLPGRSGNFTIHRNFNGTFLTEEDCYMAAVYFIDGQALEPTAFGRYNTAGVWVPVDYTGTYGDNGFHLDFSDPSNVGKDYSGNGNDFTATGFDTTAYASGQFVHDDFAYDTGTNTVPTGGTEAPYFIDIVDPINTNKWATFNPTGAFNGKVSGTGNSDGTYLYGSNSTQACNELTFDLRDFPTVTNCAIWAGWNQADGTTTSAKVYLLDSSKNEIAGTSVTPVRIGNSCQRLEMCSTDVGASYIKFDLSAANSYFFLWGIEVNGQLLSQEATLAPTYDIMQDSPTQNFATYNPVDPNTQGSLRYANLLQTDGGYSPYNTSATQVISPDKYVYFETTYRANFPGIVNPAFGQWTMLFGIGPTNGAAGETGAGYPTNDPKYFFTDAVFGFGLNGNMYNNFGEVDPSTNSGDGTMFPTGSATGDVYGVEVDRPNNRIRIKRNGVTWAPTASTVDGDGWLTLNTSNTDDWYVQNKNYDTENLVPTINFGQQPFAFEPTGDHTTLSTGGSAVPAIQDGRDHFQALTGPGADILTDAQAVFDNGLWWIKDRVNANQHQLVDSVRGGNLALTCPGVAAETAYNPPTGDSVAWCWSAPDVFTPTTTSSTINQMTGARNTDAGFSIVRYNSTSASVFTMDHGLPKAPDFLISKTLAQANNFYCYHSATGDGGLFVLNTNAGVSNTANYWQVDDTTWGIGNAAAGPALAGLHVTWMWTSIPGYSAFGSYTGNSSADGPFIYTGFKPAFILIKSQAAANWVILDSTRGPTNPNNAAVYANQTTEEYSGTGYPVDFLSNGFKVRVNDAALNQNNLIYAAFAENPFSSPVTAR